MPVAPRTKVTPERYPWGCRAARLHELAEWVSAATSVSAVGAAKSPPTAMPRCGLANAMPKMPAEAPRTTGVVSTPQVRPPSREWKTRDPSGPPLPNHASWPRVVRHSPLAANPNSLARAGGMPSGDCTVQCAPPLDVRRIRNFPSTGSGSTRPWRGSKKPMQSKTAAGSVFSYVNCQVAPPSEVAYKRESVPVPAAMTTARRASNAVMSRNCRLPAPGTETSDQLRPPSVVRSTTPSYPLTHATFLLTAARPRKCEALPVSSSCQVKARAGAALELGTASARTTTIVARADTAPRKAPWRIDRT